MLLDVGVSSLPLNEVGNARARETITWESRNSESL
jgi:hypothetical protein